MDDFTRRRFRNLLALVLLAFTLSLASSTVACGPKATTVTVPGALNNTDAQLYASITAAQAAIEQAKMGIAAFPQFKDALNRIIASYNTVEAGYQSYHVSKTGDLSALQAQVLILTTDIGKLQVSMGVKK